MLFTEIEMQKKTNIQLHEGISVKEDYIYPNKMSVPKLFIIKKSVSLQFYANIVFYFLE